VSTSWRLILDPPSDGAWNMAVDEALLRACDTGTATFDTTLRLYGWRPAALSLGRTQPAAGAHDAAMLRDEGIDLVRRPTGGRAVLHDAERTYALVSRRSGAFPGGVLDTYRRISRALEQALLALGLAPEIAPRGPLRERDGGEGRASCFARVSAHEIVLGGRKVVGSAQLRGRNAFLQHGSILLRADATRVGRATGTRVDSGSFAGLEEACGRRLPSEELDRALIRAFEAVCGAGFVEAALSDEERISATRLRATKYLSAAWTLHGARADDDSWDRMPGASGSG
jgi:lipoate-protein ligase A